MYKCNKCGMVSTAIAWNTKTRIKVNIREEDDITPIENNTCGSFFYCPNCNEISDRDDINNILGDEKVNIAVSKEDDIKWLLEELLEAGRYAEVDFDKITEIAKRNGYEIGEELDIIEIEEQIGENTYCNGN